MRTLKSIILIGLVISAVSILGCSGAEVDKAKALIIDKKYSQAIELLGDRVTPKSENADAHFLMGVAYSNTGQLLKAEEHYSHAARLKPHYAGKIGWEYKRAGEDALREGNSVGAVRLFQAAIHYDPKLKKDIARRAYKQGVDFSRADKDALSLEWHQYALANDPLLGKDLGKWYALKAQEAKSAPDRAKLNGLALQFEAVYREAHTQARQASVKLEAEKQVLSVRAKLAWAIERRVDEYAWERYAYKGSKTLADEEIAQWSVKYYQAAGHNIKKMVLRDKEWVRLASVADQSYMFFLSAKDVWYKKSAINTPQNLGVATTRAQGILFRGGENMALSVRTESPPADLFYWITPRP